MAIPNIQRYYDDRNIMDEITSKPVDLVLNGHLG